MGTREGVGEPFICAGLTSQTMFLGSDLIEMAVLTWPCLVALLCSTHQRRVCRISMFSNEAASGCCAVGRSVHFPPGDTENQSLTPKIL
eukprot:358826-Chlamydomonas_euryale.AAC.3